MTREVAETITQIEAEEKQPQLSGKQLNDMIDEQLQIKAKEHVAKKEEKAERKEEQRLESQKRKEKGEKAAFIVEKDSTGLLFVRLDGAGNLPKLLVGKKYTNRFNLELDLQQVEKDAKGEKRETIFKA